MSSFSAHVKYTPCFASVCTVLGGGGGPVRGWVGGGWWGVGGSFWQCHVMM